MQRLHENNASPAIPGIAAAALKRYSSERASIVAATDSAWRSIGKLPYAQQPTIVGRDAPEIAGLLDALSKNQLSNVRDRLLNGLSADTLIANVHNAEHSSLLSHAPSAFAVRLLLDAGANPNARRGVHMMNPLTAVIRNLPNRERAEAIDILLQAGADPNGSNGLGASPLDAALAKPDISAVMLLVDAGAKVDRFAFVAMIQSYNERTHRASADPELLEVHKQKAKQCVDLLVYGSENGELAQILKDPEVARLLRLTPEIKEFVAKYEGRELAKKTYDVVFH